MNYEKCCDTVNQIISHSRLSKTSDFFEVKEPFISKCGITIVGKELVSNYNKSISQLYRTHNEIEPTISFEYFENSILHIVESHVSINTKCGVNEIKALFDTILKMPIIEREIFYFLKGAKLDNIKSSIGDFKIYKYPDCIQLLTDKYKTFYEHDKFLIDSEKSNALISVNVSSREEKRGIEIADGLIRTFENVVNYTIGDLRHYHSVGVFTYRQWSSISRVTCNEITGIGYYTNNIHSVPVNFKHSVNELTNNKKLFKLITQTEKTELEKRILNAVEWAGKACIDFDNSKALVQLIFAIEGMLKYDDGSFITPSIISQIGDWLAFINSDDATKRLEIANHFKRIYKKRSAIAHGGNSEIDLNDIAIALQLVKLTVNTFLTTEPYINMKTVKEVSNYITDLKYK